MSRPIATIRKNAREELRVSVDEFHGHHLLNLRVWFEAEDGQMRPGKQGLAVRVALLPELRAALAKVDAEGYGKEA
jgi:hypothetical protein